MCGRFAQKNIIKSTSDIVKTIIGKVDNIDNFNISPGQEAAVIKKYTNGKALEILLWDGIIIKNVVNHITKSRIRLLIIKKSLEK